MNNNINIMDKKAIGVFCSQLLISVAHAQQILFRPTMKYGILCNGITYYIAHNEFSNKKIK